MNKSILPFTNPLSHEIYNLTYKLDKDTDIHASLRRVAKTLASVEENKKHWEEEFFRILSDFKNSVGGRILSNAGAGFAKTTMINCFVSGFRGKDQDSMAGILEELKRQANILRSEGGYGCNFDTLRPKGAYIEGIGSSSPGAVAMMEMWDTAARVITKGSGKENKKKGGKKKIRKGAMMATLSCWHGDIEEFIKVKQAQGKLSQFNMSILITDEFMEAVKNKKPWNLEHPTINKDTKKDYEDIWLGDLSDWKKRGLPTDILKTYEDANELWDLIMRSTYNRAEPGVLFVDRANYLNNLRYLERINATNPCLTADTLVYVADGRGSVPIGELARSGKDVPVFCTNDRGQTTIRTMVNPRLTGENKEIIKITLKDGTSIKGTINHKLRRRNTEWVEMQDLKIGEELALLIKKEENQESEAQISESIFGGVTSERELVEKKIVSRNIRIRLSGDGKTVHKDCPVCLSKFSVPSHQREAKYCTDKCREEGVVLDEVVTRLNYEEYMELNSKMKTCVSNPIVEIETGKKEDVYNGTVDDFHNFFVGGYETISTDGKKVKTYVSTRNCGEQILPPDGSCLLGSINLVHYINEDKTDFDYNKLAKDIPVFNRMLDNVNDITHVPLKEQKKSLLDKRRIGVGYLGYGSALMMMKLAYGSKKALELTDKLASFVTNALYKSSALLAKEKGAFPLYDETKYLASNFLKNLNPETIDLIRKYGIRNSHLTSIQPTGNTSILCNNVSGGLEPIFMLEYIRTSIVQIKPDGLTVPSVVNFANNTYDYSSDDFIEDLKPAEWKWIKEGDESLLHTVFEDKVYKIDNNRGLLREDTIQDYSLLNSEEGIDESLDYVTTALNGKISVDHHLDTMAVFAKYIDSAISKTINIPNDYDFEDFKKVYMKAYDTGVIKGCTTYRAGTMTSVLKDANEKTESDVSINAQERGEYLECDLFQVSAENRKWIVVVGLKDAKPYEVFAFPSDNLRFPFPKEIEKAVLVKMKTKDKNKSIYNLEIGSWVLRDVLSHFETHSQESVTRMASLALRHGIEVEFVVSQLAKAHGTVVSFNKAIARTLKKYITGEVKSAKCTECNSKNVSFQEGCFVCMDCGSSKCS